MFFRRLPFFVLASLLVTLPALTGCGGGLVSKVASVAAIALTGNWQISSNAATASHLPAISGELTGTTTSITGILHSNSKTACIDPSQSFAVTGSANQNKVITLTGTNVAGGTLTVTGTLAADGKSFSNTTYNVTGGSCAFTAPAAATAQAFAPINGTYNGNFVDNNGDAIAVSASLMQTSQANTDGNFTLSGTGTFPHNPCFSSPVSVSDAQVTGGSFTLTYADQNTGNSVTGSGTFSSDGTTLTLSGWVLSGPCGPQQGTGVLTKQ